MEEEGFLGGETPTPTEVEQALDVTTLREQAFMVGGDGSRS